MGIISILLGIISFFGFTGAGILLANSLLETTIPSILSVSPTMLMICVIALFAFIGLLICINLVMHGITYNRLGKVYKLLKRKY